MSDIVERLKEKIITDAFVEGLITSGALAERLIRERLDAADEIEKLRSALEPFARMAADYEDWETEKITMIVLLYHLRDAAAAIRESGE